MSVRIHELAKKIGIGNKELLALLQERHFQVKSVSSTIDTISADALVEEFANKPKSDAPAAESLEPEAAEPAEAPAPAAPEPRRTTVVEVAPVDHGQPAPASAARIATTSPAAAPAGNRFVRSADEIAKEREEAENAKRLNPVSAPMFRPAQPATPVLRTPSAPAPVSAPPPLAPRPAGPVSTPPPLAPIVRKSPPPAAPIAVSPVRLGGPANPPPFAPRVVPGGPIPAPGSQSRPAPVPAPSPAAGSPAPVVPGVRPAPVAPAPQAAPAPVAPPVQAASPAPAAPPPLSPVSRPPVSAPLSFAPKAALPVGAGPAAPHTGEARILSIKPPIVVKDFATMMGMRGFQLINELMKMGIFAGLNQAIEENIASQLAERHGFLLEVKHRGESQQQVVKPKKVEVDEATLLRPRPPVVVVMGHVDHGKTSLLDSIRKANVVSGEAGGITQHMGAYQVERNGQKITFLDTPGHAAFTQMRSRGASVGDIVVLVVAADDGFMPQTDEALKIARAAKSSIIACINKVDVKGANIDRVKQMLQERGLTPEDWGGETLVALTSAIKGQGVPELLDSVLLQAEVLELKANPTAEASGLIIEAQTQVGIGHTATVIVQRGTLKVGDSLVCGPHYTKVRTMLDERGKPMKEAGPSTPVRVPGWSGVPDVGAGFKAVKNDKEARRIAEENEFELKQQASNLRVEKPVGPTSAAELLQFINQTQKKTLKVLVKADVYGSAEAIEAMLSNIKSDKVVLDVIAAGVGLITKNDVLMASAGGAEIVGFQVKREPGVDALAKHHGVRITDYDIIYELYDGLRNQMADLLEPELKETKVGLAQVRAVFPISKGHVAGCLVTEGRVVKDFMARVWRKRQVVHTGKLSAIRRVKDEVNEVKAGTECGIRLDTYGEYQPGDEIECFEVTKIRASL